jgi:hypothetical protein
MSKIGKRKGANYVFNYSRNQIAGTLDHKTINELMLEWARRATTVTHQKVTLEDAEYLLRRF